MAQCRHHVEKYARTFCMLLQNIGGRCFSKQYFACHIGAAKWRGVVSYCCRVLREPLIVVAEVGEAGSIVKLDGEGPAKSDHHHRRRVMSAGSK